MKNVGIIGYGYWGPNLVRNFMGNKNFKVIKVADSRQERLELVKRQYPNVIAVSDTDDILSDPEVDAVAIATPVFAHFHLAKKALLNGKHVLLEKPMTATSQEAEELIGLAEQKGLTLMVDHTFLYTGSVQKIKSLINDNNIGKVKYLDSTRINLGLFQPDINVLWDLAPHDISILAYLLDENPFSLNTTGVSHTSNGLENIAYLTVNFESGFIAHFNCSWTSPVKIRLMLIGGDKKMIVFNDLEPTEKIKVYDTGYEIKNDDDRKKLLIDYRSGDIFIPKVPATEALALMVEDFAQAVLTGRKPIADHQSGLYVIKILEASAQSLKLKGAEVIIK